MTNNKPNVVLLMKNKINIEDFINIMKKEWNYECTLEKSQKASFINYLFNYNNTTITLSMFDTKFPEDISKDIINSKYASKAEEFYNCHNNFCIVSVLENSITDINMLYANFTRVIMALLLSNNSEESFVYDMRSRQAIDKNIYMQMFDNMKSWHKQNEKIFPIDWYVNYIIYKNDNKYNAVTIGFEAFNDYEIEIHNKDVTAEEMMSIVKFIVINVISRQDKIKNRDLIPIPVGQDYDEAVIKQAKSQVLNKETLVVIF